MNEQKSVYETAKDMNVTRPYACGWYNDPILGFGYQLVRMSDGFVVYQGGERSTLDNVKCEMWDRDINKNQVAFI